MEMNAAFSHKNPKGTSNSASFIKHQLDRHTYSLSKEVREERREAGLGRGQGKKKMKREGER